MKIVSAPQLVLDTKLYEFGLKTMREQSMFIMPRFYMGSEMNNYDLWKLSSWFDNTNAATKVLENTVENYARPFAASLYKEPELRELVFCCGGTRHSNKVFTDHNYLNGISHRVHYVHEGEGWLTNIEGRETTAFGPGAVMLFEPADSGKRWHIRFTTPVLTATVAVWTEKSAKKNWVLFAEHAASQQKPKELPVFDI